MPDSCGPALRDRVLGHRSSKISGPACCLRGVSGDPLLYQRLKSTSRGFSGTAHGSIWLSANSSPRPHGRSRYKNSKRQCRSGRGPAIRRRPLPRPRLPSPQNAQRNYERYLDWRAPRCCGDQIAARTLQHAEHYLRSMREHALASRHAPLGTRPANRAFDRRTSSREEPMSRTALQLTLSVLLLGCSDALAQSGA